MIDERDRTLDDLDSDADAEDFFDDRESCGENMCHCGCGQGHVCGCDCTRCGGCQQLTENCRCDDDY